MSQNTKILQLYYKTDQIQYLDPAFTLYDNTDNLRPELREWYVWDKTFEQQFSVDTDYLGYVSWKFKEKTNLSGQQVIDHIANNPGADVYLFNPCILNEALFINSWVQGDMYHPGISAIGNTFMKKLGYDNYDVQTLVLDRNRTVFANYVVGNRKFWDGFMEFSRRLFTESESDYIFEQQVFGAGLSNYAHDKTLPNFTFLIERLLPIYLEISNLTVKPYVYTIDTVADKYKPIFNEIMLLSSLKVAINTYSSDELYHIWENARNIFLNRYGAGVLTLE